MHDAQMTEMKQLCSGRLLVFIHPFIYRTLNLTFLEDVGPLFLDGTIKNEMGTGSMEQVVGVPTPAIFNAVE